MLTQILGTNQIKDTSIPLSKLIANFLNGSDWNITNGNNDATITGLVDPSNPQDVATKNYVDGLVDASLKAPEAYDASVNAYPTTYGGDAIQAGDSWRITGAGTMGTRTVNVEDLLIATVDGASGDADFMVAESNRDQATESTLGVAKIATQAIADAGTNDTDIITPLKLETYLLNNGFESLTFENGLTNTTGVVGLGGKLNQNTTILGADAEDVDLIIGAYFSNRINEFRLHTVESRIIGGDLGADNYSDVTLDEGRASLERYTMGGPNGLNITDSGMVVADSYASKGLEYANDYSSNFTARSLVDKEYVDNAGVVSHYGEAPTVTDGNAEVSALTNLGSSGVQNVRVYLNGLRQYVGAGNDYTINLTTGVITFEFNLSAGDVVLVDYQENNS